MTKSFKTTLHCDRCVEKIKPHFDTDPQINKWTVETIGNVKILHISGKSITKAFVNEKLKKAGYEIVGSFWMDISVWKRAIFNTANCLLGCSIGDFGMVIFIQAFYPATPLWLQMLLAIIAGLCTSILLETGILKLRESMPWNVAFKTALHMSLLSMVAMELAMTGTDFMITKGQLPINDPVYWLALLPALLVGFLTPLPYNYYKLKKYNKSCH